jgi:hypothetical protein
VGYVGRGLHGLTVYFHDDVSALQASVISGTSGDNIVYDRAVNVSSESAALTRSSLLQFIASVLVQIAKT